MPATSSTYVQHALWNYPSRALREQKTKLLTARGPGSTVCMVSGGEGRNAPVAANVDVVVGENRRSAYGAANALQDEARRIGAGAVAHWHILGHWLTWSNPAHLPAGRSHLSYSASALWRKTLSMLDLRLRER